MSKYTAIIPYYKGRKTLPICLSSFVSNRNHLEKIIISKDSDDFIGDIVEEFESCFDIPVEVIYVPKNISNGPGVTRQYALDRVTTEYVVFCDQDDCYLPYSIDKMFNIANNSKGRKMGVVYGRVEKLYPEKDEIGIEFNTEYDENSTHHTNLVNGALWNMEFIKEAKLSFHPKMYMMEDIYFNSLVSIYFDKFGFEKWDFCITPYTTYVWTTHSNQYSTIHQKDFWCNQLIYFYKRFLYTYEILDANDSIYNMRLRRHCYSVLIFSYCYINKALNQGATEEQLNLYFTYLKRLLIIFQELTDATLENIYQEMIRKIREEDKEIQENAGGINYVLSFEKYWDMLMIAEPIKLEDA